MVKWVYPALLALGGGHLLLVSLGASYVGLEDFGRIGQALNFYGEMSGSNKSYGFFAPGVGSQVRTQFEVIDARGKAQRISLERASSHEADLRIANITSQLAGDNDGEQDDAAEAEHDDKDQLQAKHSDEESATELRRSMAASLAGKVFGRYPGAQAVIVHVDEFEPLNMPEYRAGQRPAWAEIYQAKFVQETTPASQETL